MSEIYLGKRIKPPKVLKEGFKDGFQFAILTLGSHPCAYIGVDSNNKFFGLDCDEIYEKFGYDAIDCHGGITYTSEEIQEVKNDGFRWWIGWDYAHSGDFTDYANMLSVELSNAFKRILERNPFGKHKRWLLDEIYIELLDVIKQLKKWEKK